MRRFVVDTSLSLAWCFVEEQNSFTQRLLDALEDAVAVVPSIWPIETANVLALAERKGRIDQAGSKAYLEVLRELRIEIDSETSSHAFGDVLSLARSQNLTAYDAAYLELAMREGIPLATRDVELVRAAKQVGVPLEPAL